MPRLSLPRRRRKPRGKKPARECYAWQLLRTAEATREARLLGSALGRFDKADGAAFLWCAIAYKLEGQVHREQIRQDFAVVMLVVLAIQNKPMRLEVADSGDQNRCVTLRGIIHFELLTFSQLVLRDLDLLSELPEAV